MRKEGKAERDLRREEGREKRRRAMKENSWRKIKKRESSE